MTHGCSHMHAKTSTKCYLRISHLLTILGVFLANSMVFGMLNLQFTPYAPHHNHPNCLHLIMGAHLPCLESIKCHDFQFGQKYFNYLFPSVVLILPSSSRNSFKIWPTMKFCPTSPSPPWSNVPSSFCGQKISHHCNKFVIASKILHSEHSKNPSKF